MADEWSKILSQTPNQYEKLETEEIMPIWDKASFHVDDEHHQLPEQIRLLPLPVYCAELNPIERLGGYGFRLGAASHQH